ncbi:MAG: universal stress protein [Kiloniellales bacterium]|nr:universal stress protein [Kiloniellales bacterium]
MLLAVIDGGADSESVVSTALRIGQRFGSHVQILHPRPHVAPAVPIVAEGFAAGAVTRTVDAIEAAAEERAAAARAVYQKLCVAAGLPLVESGSRKAGFAVGFEEVTGDAEATVIRYGRLADLIVLSRPDDTKRGLPLGIMEAALFETGRPIVVAPAEPREIVAEIVAIGWNDTRESARALGAAMPFLLKAEGIHILSVHDAGCEADPVAVERYLSRQGLSAVSRTLEPDYRPIGEQLLDEAKASNADLLVMGGYGHSRLREMVLGGATRTVIGQATIPVLMAH